MTSLEGVPGGRRRMRGVSNQQAAALYHGRERRLSQAGKPELFRTHDYPIPTPAIDTGAQFPKRDFLITFATKIRITGAAPAGLIFELGEQASGCAAWVDGNEIGFRAGDSAVQPDKAVATFTYPAAVIPVGWQAVLEFAVRPNDGRIRIYADGLEIARDTAIADTMPQWGSAAGGSFASAVNGTTPLDVPQTGAPFDFDVIERLSVYDKQVPRHFV